MNVKKLDLDHLQVQSFITALDKARGHVGGGSTYDIGCCPPSATEDLACCPPSATEDLACCG